jgi:hypothetical protein
MPASKEDEDPTVSNASAAARSRAAWERSIIVVGNGASVLAQPLGHLIDEFDDVVRLNNFRIEGHEPFVGRKTTIWARNNMRDIADRDGAAFREVWICAPRWAVGSSVPFWVRWRRSTFTIGVNRLRRMYPGSLVVDEATLLDIEWRMEITDPRRQWPSAGLIAVAYAVSRSGRVCIHGFDHFAATSGKPRHYFNGMETMTGFEPHPPELERRYVLGLIEQGAVWRLSDSAPAPAGAPTLPED